MIDQIGTEPPAHGTGFKLVRVYAIEQFYRNRADEKHAQAGAKGRQFQLGWDWRIIGTQIFEVLLSVTALPSAEQPDEAKVSIAATFEASAAPTVPLQDFVRSNAVALLVPFVREALAQLTARGPFGTFLLTPLNVVAVMNGFDPARASGIRQLREDPTLAQQFGVAERALT